MTTGYESNAIWIAIVAIGIATYAIRLSFIYLFGRIDSVPPRVKRALNLVPAAVLAALVVPALLTIRPSVTETILDERLLAGIVAGVVAWQTEDVLATIIAGMGTLWFLRFVIL